jgi:hypothetical protein
VVGAATQPLGVNIGGGSVAGSTTVYEQFSGTVLGAAATTPSSATSVYQIAPYAFTASKLCVSLKGAQPSGGTLAVTLWDVPASGSWSTPAATSLTIAVPASGGIGVYCDRTDTASIASTDAFYLALVNGSGSTSATIYSISMMTSLPGGETGMILWGFNGSTMQSTHFYAPFTSVAGSGNAGEAQEEAAMPRALTASNLNCWATVAPGTNSATLTVRQNTASPASGLVATFPLATTGLIQDVTHTISYANQDLFSILYTQTSGTVATVTSCSMAVN